MSFTVIEGTLAAAVATSGTFTASYPSGYNPGSFFGAVGHKITVNGTPYFYPTDFSVTPGAASITITNRDAATWPAGATFRLQLETQGDRSQLTVPLEFPNSQTEQIGTSVSQSINVRAKLIPSTTEAYVDIVNLGAPIALDADGIALAQNVSAGANMTLNGTLASGGAVTLDVPRALSVDSGGADTAVLTITGTDVYGRPMTEAITLNGNTQVNGKKAFKTVSSISSSATTTNSPFVGTTDILGLPVYVPSEGYVIAELQDGHPRGAAQSHMVQFVYPQTELLAPTGIELISPVNGFIVGARAIVQTAITTGGNIQVQVGTTAVTGLTLVFADGAAAGTIASDTPTTPYSSTTVVTNGGRIRVLSDASFATAGAVNGYVEIVGTNGLFTAGVLTAGGSTTTSGDVRATYVPSVACDGATTFQLVLCLGQQAAGQAQNVEGA